MHRPRNNNEAGSLPQLASMLGMDTLCVCGEAEMHHNTLPGEDGRCTVCACERFTPARKSQQATASASGEAAA